MKPHDPIEDLLRRRTVPSAPAGGPLCGDPELLAAYAENSLDAAGRDEFQAHLAVCNACQESVAALVRMSPRPAVVTESPVRASAWWKWILLAAPALAAVALVFVMMRPAPTTVATIPAASAPVASPRSDSTQVMIVTNESQAPVAKPARPLDRDRQEPLKQKKEAESSTAGSNAAESKVSDSKAASKASGDVEVASSSAGVEATPAPPPAPAPVFNARNSAAGANMQSQLARGPYVQQNGNNATQQGLSFAQKDQAAAAPPPLVAPEVTAAASANRTLAKIAIPKTEIPARIEKGVLRISIDAGLNWQVLKTPEEVESAKFTDPLNGEIVGISHAVYRTKDGGKNWVKQNAR